MKVVLGIDAAWTAKEPSGVALIVNSGSGWRLLVANSSYDAFLSDDDTTVPSRHRGSVPQPVAILGATKARAGQLPDIIAIDMPLSLDTISGRRAADNVVSSLYGARHAATHTPSSGGISIDPTNSCSLSRTSAVTERTLRTVTHDRFQMLRGCLGSPFVAFIIDLRELEPAARLRMKKDYNQCFGFCGIDRLLSIGTRPDDEVPLSWVCVMRSDDALSYYKAIAGVSRASADENGRGFVRVVQKVLL